MKKLNVTQIIFWFCLITSIGLSVAGFIVPPTGIIDGSVLTVIGELLGFAALGQLPMLLSKKSFEISHGKTHLSVGDNDDHEEYTDLNEQV